MPARRAARFAPQLLSPAEGLRRALASPMGLVAVTDPADNPYSGGAADTPALFKALLALRPKVATVFAYFADAEVVAAAHAAGVGGRLAVTLGAKATSAFGRGVPVAARVLRLAQARFTNSGPMEYGLTVDLGASAVLDVGGIAVVVTTHCGPANDPAFFAAHGIDLAATRLLCCARQEPLPRRLRLALRGDHRCRLPRAGDGGCGKAAGYRRPRRLVGAAVAQDAISTSCAAWPLPLLGSDHSTGLPSPAALQLQRSVDL